MVLLADVAIVPAIEFNPIVGLLMLSLPILIEWLVLQRLGWESKRALSFLSRKRGADHGWNAVWAVRDAGGGRNGPPPARIAELAAAFLRLARRTMITLPVLLFGCKLRCARGRCGASNTAP